MYQLTSEAFPGVLMREWSYVSVRELICDLPELPVCLSMSEGALSSRWSMWFGGSESRSQLLVRGSIYSAIQDDSKQKSAIGAWLMFGNLIT